MPTTIAPTSPPDVGRSLGADTRLEIDTTHARQTERPTTPFRNVLAGGVSLLMSGAELATHVVAGPVMAAAVHDARLGATTAIAGSSTVTGAAGLAAPSPGGENASTVQGMVQDGQTSNLQLLALQQQIQDESQQFTTVSNVMRAKYDTAKSALSNIRA